MSDVVSTYSGAVTQWQDIVQVDAAAWNVRDVIGSVVRLLIARHGDRYQTTSR